MLPGPNPFSDSNPEIRCILWIDRQEDGYLWVCVERAERGQSGHLEVTEARYGPHYPADCGDLCVSEAVAELHRYLSIDLLQLRLFNALEPGTPI